MATPNPQVPTWMVGQPDEAEYLQAMIDGDTRTIAAFDSIYNQPFVGPQIPATTGDTAPTQQRVQERKKDPFGTFTPAGEELRLQGVEAGMGKGYETEQELTEFTFVDPAIELPKKVLMMDLTEEEQRQFRQMTEYFMDQGSSARDAMYQARNRLRIIRESTRTMPYPMPVVEEGQAGMRVEPYQNQVDRPLGFFEALERQTLQTPEVYQNQEYLRQRGAKERQTMETSFRITADAEAEAKGYVAGTQDYDDYVEPRVIALRRDWLEHKMPIEMIQMAREIVRYEQESQMTDIQKPVDPNTGEVAATFVPVDVMSPALRTRVTEIANGLIYDYEQGVYPADWMAKPLGGNDPNYSYAAKSTTDKMMENIFTTRTETGELVETRTAQTLRGVGGLIRPVTEAVTELTTYDVDAQGNPLDPNDINYGAWIGQPIYRMEEGTGERTDLPKAILEEQGLAGWAARTNESIARGRFMGEDFMDNQGLAKAMGDENAWVFGLGIELMLPLTPLPIVKGAGKTLEATGRALPKVSKSLTATGAGLKATAKGVGPLVDTTAAGQVGAKAQSMTGTGLMATGVVAKGAAPVFVTSGKALKVIGDPIGSVGRFAGDVRIKAAANQVAGESSPNAKAFRDQIADEAKHIVGSSISTDRMLAETAAAERVNARTNFKFDEAERAKFGELPPERADFGWRTPSEIPVPEVARTAQLFDDTMDAIEEAARIQEETINGVLNPALQGNFGGRFAYWLGQAMDGYDAQAFYAGLKAGAPKEVVNETNRLAAKYTAPIVVEVGDGVTVPATSEATRFVMRKMGAQEVENLFTTVGQERYFFVTPNLVAKEEAVRSIMLGEDTAEGIGRGMVPGSTSVAGRRARPIGLQKEMSDNIKVEIAEDGSGIIKVESELLGGKPLIELMENGRPMVDRANVPEPAWARKVTNNAIRFDSVEEMTELFGYLKGGLFKERLGAIEPMRMSQAGFDAASEPLERRLRTRQVQTIFGTVLDTTPLGEPIRKWSSAIRKQLGFDPSKVEKQVPVPTLRTLKDIKNELDNIPRAVAEDAKRIRREHPDYTPTQVLNQALEEATDVVIEKYRVRYQGGLSETPIGRRILQTPEGVKEVENIRRITASITLDDGGLMERIMTDTYVQGKVGQALKEEQVAEMVAKFFGEDGATIAKSEYIDIATRALQNQNNNFLEAFKEGVAEVRNKYPALTRKGFGGKISGDNFSVYLLTYLGDQKKNVIFLNKFDEFAKANPHLVVTPTRRGAYVRKFGPDVMAQMLDGLGAFNEGKKLVMSQILQEAMSGQAAGSMEFFKRRWVKAMDDLFSEGKIKEGRGLNALGITEFLDVAVTMNTVKEVRMILTEVLGDPVRVDKVMEEMTDLMGTNTATGKSFQLNRDFKEAMKKLVMEMKQEEVMKLMGLETDAIQQYLKQQGIPSSPLPDLNAAKPALVALDEKSFFLTDFIGAAEIRKLKQMTAAGKLDDAIRFYNTRGQTVADYVLGSLGRILETGTQNIKGGMLGGTLAPNGRYLGVNTFTAWSIASVTAPSYTASAMLRAFPAMLQQFSKSAERFGTAGTAGAFGAFGAFLDFMTGGSPLTMALSGVAGAGLGGTMAKVLEATRGKNWRGMSAVLQDYGDIKPNQVVLTTIEGRPVTAGQLHEMLIRNNIYRSEVSFEYGTQVLQELQRAYQVTAKANSGIAEVVGRFLDGAGGGMVGRKSFWNVMAEESDNAFRTQVFVDSIAMGMTEEQAAFMARTVLLDYGAIPAAAKQYLRPLLLFFAFTSQITKEAFLAFLRADSSGASNIARQIRLSQEFSKKERTDILNQMANRNLTRLWSYFGDSFDEYHTIHYGLQSPAIEGFYNFVELGLFLNDAFIDDAFGLDPDRAIAFKEKFVLGGNPILKQYVQPYIGAESDPQGFLTAREAIAIEQSGQMPYAMKTFGLEKITDPEKLRAGEPTFSGAQYRFKDAKGKLAYKHWKTFTLAMAVDRNITDWGTSEAMRLGLQGGEMKRFKGEWYLYAIGLDTPIKAPNYIQLQDKVKAQQMKELKSFKK